MKILIALSFVLFLLVINLNTVQGSFVTGNLSCFSISNGVRVSDQINANNYNVSHTKTCEGSSIVEFSCLLDSWATEYDNADNNTGEGILYSKTPTACNQPPADICVGNFLQDYTTGICNAGLCEYSYTTSQECEFGCSDGACNACQENWKCKSWSPSECPVSGQQSRTCTDSNNCGTEDNKPAELKSCNFPGFTCEKTPEGVVITNSYGEKLEKKNSCKGNSVVRYSCLQKAALSEKLLVDEYRKECEFGSECRQGSCEKIVVKKIEKNNKTYYCKGFKGDTFELPDPGFGERENFNCVAAEIGGCFEIFSEEKGESVLQFSSEWSVERWNTGNTKWKCDGSQTVAEPVSAQGEDIRITRLLNSIRSFDPLAIFYLFFFLF